MQTFTWCPAYGVTMTKTPRVKRAVFGDGYMQRATDGINAQPRSFSVTFNKKSGTVTDIEAFLASMGAVEPFLWIPFDAKLGAFICSSWNLSRTGPNAGTLTAQFDEVFEGVLPSPTPGPGAETFYLLAAPGDRLQVNGSGDLLLY